MTLEIRVKPRATICGPRGRRKKTVFIRNLDAQTEIHECTGKASKVKFELQSSIVGDIQLGGEENRLHR